MQHKNFSHHRYKTHKLGVVRIYCYDYIDTNLSKKAKEKAII